MALDKDTPLTAAARVAELLRARVKPEAAAWLQAQLAQASRAGADRAGLIAAFGSAGRRFGSAPLALEPAADELDAALAMPLGQRGLDEAARVALVLAAVAGEAERPAGTPSGAPALLAELFHRGDAREKQAVLRALPLLPEPQGHLELAVEAVRSSVLTVFEAIACENPFPAEQFSDAAFNQLVLKALFNEVRAQRIAGLERRANAELARMAEGYAQERRAAGRSVPADIEVIVALAQRGAGRSTR